MIALPVDEESRVGEARRFAVAEAVRIGLDAEARDRVALVATECASNLLHHARNGEVAIRSTPGRPGRASTIDVIGMDDGPGIASIDRAMVDGFTTLGPGRLGAGLGAMRRLADGFDIHSDPAGTTVTARIGVEDDARDFVDGFVLAKPGETVSGDAWAARRSETAWVVMLVDGLGHGVNAAKAAEAAVAAFSGAPSGELDDLVDAVTSSLKGERGAAALVFAAPLGGGEATGWGLGNIRGELVDGGARSGVVSSPGIAGRGDRRRAAAAYPWSATSLLALSTDGLREDGRDGLPPALRARAPLTIAATLMKRRRRGNDDAGVLILKGSAR